MIDPAKYHKWQSNDDDRMFDMVAVAFDPKMKDHHIKIGGFEFDCEMPYKSKFANILARQIGRYVGNKFLARLSNARCSWLPLWMSRRHDLGEIREEPK